MRTGVLSPGFSPAAQSGRREQAGSLERGLELGNQLEGLN
jgi:hypothetical protein